jgi:hypothetical protein
MTETLDTRRLALVSAASSGGRRTHMLLSRD